MKITVVTIAFNCVKDIEITLKSVVSQTYKNIEYIVIDGASSDGTLDIINKYSDKISYIVSEPDNGIYDAMNKGLKLATGDWIIFMNAGDSFADNDVISDIRFQDNLVCIYGNAIYLRENGEEYKIAKEPDYIRWRNMPTTHQAFFLRTDDAKSIGFDMSYKYDADYNMIYQIYMKYQGKGFKHINRTICRYEAFEGLTMKHEKDVFGETLRIRKDHTFQWYKDYLIWLKKCVFE